MGCNSISIPRISRNKKNPHYGKTVTKNGDEINEFLNVKNDQGGHKL